MHQPIETEPVQKEKSSPDVRNELLKAFEEIAKQKPRYESFRRPLSAAELAMRFR